MTSYHTFHDTIFALSSGRPPAGVAVIRLSGPQVPSVLDQMIRRRLVPRRLTLCPLLASDDTLLDEALVASFPAPSSFTGEHSAEFHLHGGSAVVAAVLHELSKHLGLRHAEPGEFSRRALVNGKVALTEAEALADLVDARTESQRRLAVQQRGGGHEALYAGWREQLIIARAMLEAEIDFADEDDVPGKVSEQAWESIRILRAEIGKHLAAYRRAEIIREGFRIVLAGAPNSGKSSLLNCLARRDVAIVSEEPGTTRDVMEIELDLDGMKVIVTDTAGIREADGTIEREGIRRARASALRADVVLWLTDATSVWDEVDVESTADLLRVATKVDLLGQTPLGQSADLCVSARTGYGIEGLLEACAIRAKVSDGDSGAIPFTARHIGELKMAVEAIDRALAEPEEALEFKVENLRRAGQAIGRLVGAIDVDDILDVIFARFCIGK